MQYKRSVRVGELILQEISNMLLRDIKDSRIGFVTLTGVDMSDDLRNAKLYVRILEDTKKDSSLEGLNSAAPYIRRELGKRINIRYTPELVFKIDKSAEHSEKINRILDELKKESS